MRVPSRPVPSRIFSKINVATYSLHGSREGRVLKCSLCGGETTPSTAYRRVVGWERKANVASRKGGSDILLREPRDEFACAECITRLKSGVNTHQGSLV